MVPIRILFVDDDSAVTALYRLLLARLGGFVVAVEEEGRRALETARGFRPEMIFLDCDLAGRTGRQIAAELRADRGLREVPIAYLSGGLSGDELESGEHAGLPALAKPFCPEAFLRFVRTHTPRRRGA